MHSPTPPPAATSGPGAAGGQDARQALRDHLVRLRREARAAGENYLASLRASDILVPGFTPAQREEELNSKHRVYRHMMLVSCLAPLRQGVSIAAVIQAVGMWTTMMTLSPAMRHELGELAEPLQEKLQNHIDARARTELARAQELARRREQLTGQPVDPRLHLRHKTQERLHDLAYRESGGTTAHDRNQRRHDGATRFQYSRAAEQAARHTATTGTRATAEEFLSARWQRRMNDLRFRERGHREMHTAWSAGLTYVGLAENAFWQLRQPHADRTQIMRSFRAMTGLLRQQCREDGLNVQEVTTASRIIQGEMREADLASVFTETAHGTFTPSPPRPTSLWPSMRTHDVYRGEFETHRGQKMRPDHLFTVRPPQKPDTHQALIAQTMTWRLGHAVRQGDMTRFNQALAGYLAGYAVHTTPLDILGAPAVVRAASNQTQTILTSMTHDGLGPGEQRRVYSNALVDAIEDLAATNPQFSKEWGRRYGQDWETFTRAIIDDPAAALRNWTGPGPRDDPDAEEEPGPEHREPAPARPDTPEEPETSPSAGDPWPSSDYEPR